MLAGLPRDPSPEVLAMQNALGQRYEENDEARSKVVQQAQDIRDGKRKTTDAPKIKQLSADNVGERIPLLVDTNVFLNGDYRTNCREWLEKAIQKTLSVQAKVQQRMGEAGFPDLALGLIKRNVECRLAAAEEDEAREFLQAIDKVIQANYVEIGDLEERLAAFRQQAVGLV